MASSSTVAGSLLDNQSVALSAAGENSVKNTQVALTEGETSIIPLRGSSSVYSGVNRAKDKGQIYSSFAYVKTRGRSVYLGRYTNEEEAARAHDIVTLKCCGAKGKLNFPASDYKEVMRRTQDMDDEQLIAHIRRSGSRFARGESKYRGVASGRETRKWFAHKAIRKNGLYLGTFGSEEEAAMAYDIETIRMKGWNAQTNFNLSLYDVEGIRAGTTNPHITEEVAKYLKQTTISMPLGKVEQHHAAQNYPSYYGVCYNVPPVDAAYRRYSQTVTELLSAHSNFQANNLHYYNAQQGRVPFLINMFCHSSSSPFKPYKRN